MNKQALNIMGVSKQDYIAWCRKNKLPHYKSSSKQKYFKQLIRSRNNDKTNS